jgi:hypothetical protein
MSHEALSEDQFSKYKTVPHIEEEISLSRNNYQGGSENLAAHMRRMGGLHARRQQLMGLKGGFVSGW